MNNPRIWTLAVVMSATFLFALSNASADPFFKGEIAFVGESGSATPSGGTGLADATGVNFDNNKDIIVFGKDGDFSPIPNYTSVEFFNFMFAPSTAVNPLWKIVHAGVTYQFAVDVFRILTQTDQVLDVKGTGNMIVDGYSMTPGTWVFSLNRAGRSVIGWSSSTVVPEPGTLALLGLGLLGIGFARKRGGR